MQVVIEIPEEMYKWVNDANKLYNDYGTSDFVELIKNGTPLPKGHGKLIDADETLKKHCAESCKEKPSCHEDCLIYDLFHLAQTIIEADKDGEE